METAYIIKDCRISSSYFEDKKNFSHKKFFRLSAELLNATKCKFCKNRKSVIKRLKGNPVDFVYQVHSKKRAKKRNLRYLDIKKIFYTNAYGILTSIDNPYYTPTE